MSKVAIITARGGSKRIPRKNIKPFLGKPIIAYVIETALQSTLFDEVMVSTDDTEIAEVAKAYGAKVPFMRSEKNADDYSGTADVLLEVLAQYEAMGKHFEYACRLYPTAPFVQVAHLQEAYEKLTTHNYDCVFPLVPFAAPIQRALRQDSAGKVSMFQPENYPKRSQDLEPAYHDAGQFYFFVPEALQKKRRLWTDHAAGIVLSPAEAQDIDSPEDWETAEFKYRFLQSRRK